MSYEAVRAEIDRVDQLIMEYVNLANEALDKRDIKTAQIYCKRMDELDVKRKNLVARLSF